MVVCTGLAGTRPVCGSPAVEGGAADVPAVRPRRVGRTGYGSGLGARAFGEDEPEPVRTAYPARGTAANRWSVLVRDQRLAGPASQTSEKCVPK